MKLSNRTKNKLKEHYGPWAVVTGASSGIGRELARLLAASGVHVVICGRQLEKLTALEHELKSTYAIDVLVVAADVSENKGIQTLIEATQNLNVGLFIASAGFGTSGRFLDASIHTEINLLRVNVEAVLSLTHYFGQKFAAQKRGGIILLSSIVAFQGVPFSANYAASKAYIQSFAEALAVELRSSGVAVLSAIPGPVASSFGQRANMNMNMAMRPEEIGVPILNALGRKTNIIPGKLSKLLTYALRTVPRWAKVKIMEKIMGGMTQHQRA